MKDLFEQDVAVERSNGVITRKTAMKMRNKLAKAISDLPIVKNEPKIKGRVFKDNSSKSYYVDITIISGSGDDNDKYPHRDETGKGLEKAVKIGRQVIKDVFPVIREVIDGKMIARKRKLKEWEKGSYPRLDGRTGEWIINADGVDVAHITLAYGGPYAKVMIGLYKEAK